MELPFRRLVAANAKAELALGTDTSLSHCRLQSFLIQKILSNFPPVKVHQASDMSGPDPLFDVKNALYLGNWQQCLNEVQKAKVCFGLLCLPVIDFRFISNQLHILDRLKLKSRSWSRTSSCTGLTRHRKSMASSPVKFATRCRLLCRR